MENLLRPVANTLKVLEHNVITIVFLRKGEFFRIGDSQSIANDLFWSIARSWRTLTAMVFPMIETKAAEICNESERNNISRRTTATQKIEPEIINLLPN